MAVRIYQLSKEIGMENPALIALLRERGYEVKSASSTIDNISAESLREEFRPPEDENAPAEKTEVADELKRSTAADRGKAIIRSKEDIEREREEREREERERIEAERRTQPAAVVPPRPGMPPPLPKGPPASVRPGGPPLITPPPRPTGGSAPAGPAAPKINHRSHPRRRQ